MRADGNAGAKSGLPLFGSGWAERLERELAASDSYRAAAATWKGSLAFVLEPDAGSGFDERRDLYLDLAHGSARAVRPARPGDVESASFCLAGPAGIWLRLLSGDLEPGVALMGGGLRLTRGSIFSLLPHLKAAQALLLCARQVPFSAAPRNPTS